MIRAEILTIGDELLIGQIVNTNTAWIADQLSGIGIRVERMVTVGDERPRILEAFGAAWQHNDIVIVTGGLGPTHDDISKACVAEFFGRDLYLDDAVLSQVEARFRKFGYSKMPDVNRGQALVPAGFTALKNDRGTAPGLMLREEQKLFVILPGVPFEMQGLMTSGVLPAIREEFASRMEVIRHRNLLTTGIGESSLAEKLGETKDFLPDGVTLAFLPAHGSVRLRITARGDIERDVDAKIAAVEQHIRERADRYIFGVEKETLESAAVALLTKQAKRIATAESCTAGMIAARIANVPGSSAVLLGGIVAYDNRVKIEMLNVPEEVLEEHGAVSEETVRAMAEGVRRVLRSEYSIAVTGIAGPGGGTAEKPVGTVWIAVASDAGTQARVFHFADDREKNRERATVAALEMLRQQLLQLG